MKTSRKKHNKGWKLQQGVTLVELLVAMVISLIVSTAMILLMANTMGTGTQTIQMTRLTQEMRTAMQLISRDLRRANYHSGSAECFANINCNLLVDPDASKIMAINIDGGDCFRFWYDREADGDLDVGTFQWFSGARGADTVNILQMTISDTESVTCGDDWGIARDITDADTVNIIAFTVSNAESYNESISALDTQDVSKIRLTLTAELINTPTGIPISKTIEDLIYVRNNVFCPGGTCPAP